MKILGLPENDSGRETADVSIDLCIQLYREMGVEVNIYDIDIAHRIHLRNAGFRPRPIICKFAPRLVQNKVITARKEATNVRPETTGLPTNLNASSNRNMIVEHLTPKTKLIFNEAERFQNQHNYKFCWVKNFNIFLRKTEDSNHIQIRCLQDLEPLDE